MERRAPGRNKQSTRAQRSGQAGNSVRHLQPAKRPARLSVSSSIADSNDYAIAELAAQRVPATPDYTGMLPIPATTPQRRPFLRPTDGSAGVCRCAVQAGSGTGRDGRLAHQSIAQIPDMPFDDVEVTAEQLDALRNAEYPVNNPRALEAMLAAIEEAREEQVRSAVSSGAPQSDSAGIRQPDARQRGQNLWPPSCSACPAVKGVEFGAGFAFAALRSSLYANDRFMRKRGCQNQETNNSSGILSGITSGMPLIVRVHQAYAVHRHGAGYAQHPHRPGRAAVHPRPPRPCIVTPRRAGGRGHLCRYWQIF